jgi:hypothetical protein
MKQQNIDLVFNFKQRPIEIDEPEIQEIPVQVQREIKELSDRAIYSLAAGVLALFMFALVRAINIYLG